MEEAWSGMPESTTEQIEKDVVSLIATIMEWKKRNDRPGAKWKIGTTRDAIERLEKLNDCQAQTALGLLSREKGNPQRAAQEIAEYHDMELDGNTSEEDTEIFTYTDRSPTKDERRQRVKVSLTVKQKRIFWIIKEYIVRNGRGPTKRDVMRIAGHRSPTTTNELLDILDRKNWIIVGFGRQCIETI